MDLSKVSVYDNVNPQDDFSKSGVYATINDLLSINGDVEVRIFCPLCVSSFDYKYSLFEHLRTSHNNFITEVNNQGVHFNECPFCNAKFYGKHLTAKHALLHHSKVVRELFLNKKSGKCVFCDVKLSRWGVDKHIEELHFLEFEEEFRKMFSCDTTLQMTMSELMNEEGGQGGNDSDAQDFDGASKINCYDFTDLKKQLENIKELQSNSILKDMKNSKTPRRSVRRVLRFDLPSDEQDNKENSVLRHNLNMFREINIHEHNLLCYDGKNEIDKYFGGSESWCGEPQHSSTPNKSRGKILVKDQNRRKKLETFRSYITKKEFEFQCGKCQKLFKENLELVSHVKHNHKRLINLNMWQPFYRCAICSARFYKNHYLRKHHSLHKPDLL